MKDILVGNNSLLAMNMANGLDRYVENDTGLTVDSHTDRYICNPEGIISNNRHYLNDSMMIGQPNGDAPTESQASVILGYIQMYRGTNRKDERWLDKAIYYWDAYVRFFYQGNVPTTIQRWVCNWLVNGKEPVLANYPIDWVYPTHSGFKGIILDYVNGKTKVPDGSPYFGEYLDKATFAFDGFLGWDSIVATVYGKRINGLGEEVTDWNQYGEQYDVDWIIDSKGRKIDWDGNILDNNPTEPKGTIQLKDITITGSYKTNFTCKVPIQYGGYLIGRNQPWHNRPCNVPLSKGNYGNASDAETWFCQASKYLWDETQEEKYYYAWKCSEYTLMECLDIDRLDMFFRRESGATTPFTDGISYDYWYSPDETSEDPMTVNYVRDYRGYIHGTTDKRGQLWLEQQAICFKSGKQGIVRIEYGGGNKNYPISWENTLMLSVGTKTNNENDWQKYKIVLPNTDSDEVFTREFPISSYVPNDTLLADPHLLITDDCNYSTQWVDGIYGAYSGTTVKITFGNDDSAFYIGYSGSFDVEDTPRNIVYRANTSVRLSFYDDRGYRYYYLLEPTDGLWINRLLSPEDAYYSAWYQPNYPDETGEEYIGLQNATNIVPNTSMTFGLDDDYHNGDYFEYYCINYTPQLFSSDIWTQLFTIKVEQGDYPFDFYLGDCTIINPDDDNLTYTPGVVPYSNIYVDYSNVIDGWRGLPYPGYQYPDILTRANTNKRLIKLNNQIDFMYDAQQAYYERFGELGPVMQTYVWDRWDNLKYSMTGETNVFQMEQWKDTAWSGYEPRAYYAGCNAWLELVRTNQEVPQNLIDYCENWTRWLIDYQNTYHLTPTDFPRDQVSRPLENDPTAHMLGNWLAGACSIALAGSTLEGLDRFIHLCVTELSDQYIINGTQVTGSFSPYPFGEDATMYGYYIGEVFKGLGLYLQYANNVQTIEPEVTEEPEDTQALRFNLPTYTENPVEYNYKYLKIISAPNMKVFYYIEYGDYRLGFNVDGDLVGDISKVDGIAHIKCYLDDTDLLINNGINVNIKIPSRSLFMTDEEWIEQANNILASMQDEIDLLQTKIATLEQGNSSLTSITSSITSLGSRVTTLENRATPKTESIVLYNNTAYTVTDEVR